MIIGTAKVYLYADWVHSLKEKRMIVKSIIDKTKHRFNVSIAEVENQDYHKSIVIGIACVTNSSRLANDIIQNVVNYIEGNTEALVENVYTEIL
ncbi:hypothetical protein CLHOM_28600 [Clostridium homopropionicum DSM 5847]|uniref:DUF503 domain-containing protein n=1 Tax=Clostridium homopropionicum DSM 5847 TaxID=1121318 RepID=A0A0L6Z774_9CLOT|nr:DUF503 domain-containing protein [Clostridium homopropionicum]KOA18812.1 hypothetical protein CLHOM_28600 [Clostridium homopropionicum DSM 5847]SFG76478.1 hypothetical protein SAMN04488501_1164 [Clostridium homopropionicum]